MWKSWLMYWGSCVAKSVVSQIFSQQRYPFKGMVVHHVFDYYAWTVGGTIVFTRLKRYQAIMRWTEDLFMGWERLGKGKHSLGDFVELWTCHPHQNQRHTVSTTKLCSKQQKLWPIRPRVMPKKKFTIWKVKMSKDFQTVGFLAMGPGRKEATPHWMVV